MVKKILALVMVIGILGGVLGGCAPAAEETPAATAGDTAAPKTDG